MAKNNDAFMRSVAAGLDTILNGDATGEDRKIGFALLTFEFNKTPAEGRVNYIGNGTRDDVRVALKELLARWEGRYSETTTQQ